MKKLIDDMRSALTVARMDVACVTNMIPSWCSGYTLDQYKISQLNSSRMAIEAALEYLDKMEGKNEGKD